MKVEIFGVPLVLMAALWGAVNTTLKFYELINDRRDHIFALIDDCHRCPGMSLGPLELYVTNMLPLTIGLCIFLGLISYVVWSIPSYVGDENEGLLAKSRHACKLITLLPFYGLIVFAAGGVFDAILIVQKISVGGI